MAQSHSTIRTTAAAEPSRPKPIEPPGPKGLPWLGCLDGLLRNPMRFWLGITERFGDIAKVPIKGKHVYLVASPDLLYELLVTKRNRYRKNTRYPAAVAILGDGLLLNEGEAWKRQRLITQPTFKADYIARQIPWMAERIEAYVDRWETLSDARAELEMTPEFLDLSQRVAGRYLMGPAFDGIADRFCDAAVRIKDAWPLPPKSALHALLSRSTGWNEALTAPVRDLEACFREYLAEQRQHDFADCGVLETLVHESRKQGAELDDDSLRTQLSTMFFAGHETSATSLSWIHYLLATHDDVRRKVACEAADVLGTHAPSAPELGRLVYTDQVVSESLRLYSPIHSISRVALEDDELGGYAIPKGGTIYISLYALHRREKLWPDPHRFDPERFAPEAVEARSRFAFIPFAAGHRNCIGASMSMAELKLAVAQIARRLELLLVPGQRIECAAGTTMYPRHGIRMQPRRISVGQ